MPWLAAAAVAAPIIAGAVGSAMSSGDKARALALQQQALQNIMNVNTPDAAAMRIELQKYVSAGELAPEMEQTLQQNPSLMANISTDPRLASAQMQSLGQLQQLGTSGLRPEDQAALAKITNNVNQQQQAQEAAILQNMQQRGIGGSGQELAAKLSASQGGANRASEQGLDVAGQASQRALQAIMGAGQLGGQMQAQSFGQKAQQAQAQDMINRYNTMNSQQVMGQNTAVRNAAQAQNLANKQGLMNSNTQLGNQQAIYNNQLAQQAYQNELQKAQVGAGAQNNIAGSYNNQAAQTQQMFGGIGQGVGQGLSAYGVSQAGAANQANQNNFNQQYLDILKNKRNATGSSSDSVESSYSPSGYSGSNDFNTGGYVEGGEVVSGDSPENDTIPARLSAGEMVIPKSIVEEKNPDVIHAFIKGVLAAHNKKK